MASTLCCTAEQEGRPDSPVLPNARPSGATPARQPLLPKLTESPNSRFTSFRSDELHELHQIFEHAQDDAGEHVTPQRTPRARFGRASVYSLHSLHKMSSMRSLIKRKFSRDLTKKDSASNIHIKAAQNVARNDQDTVVRVPELGAGQRLKITKENLRKDLLSDKKPDEGGYDSDAEMLDDLARDIGKKTPVKRPSIHSVNWSPSTGSKTTPCSSTNSRNDAGRNDPELQPYQIQKPPAVSLATRVGHVFSTPNLRVDVSDGTGRPFRRSQSFTSTRVPQVSPLSPLSPFRLPSLTDHDQNGVPWAEAINESLRLSQFPNPPCVERSQVLLPLETATKPVLHAHSKSGFNDRVSSKDPQKVTVTAVQPVDIRIQQATSVASPRPSTSIRGTVQENAQPSFLEQKEENDSEQEVNPRHSVHLYSMRISHHLRSGSLLSWEQLADTPELPQSMPAYRNRSVSDQSRISQLNKPISRFERQTSSSGFASSKVPSRWGKVLPMDHDAQADVASSIYSSRPQSPPGSFVEFPATFGRTITFHDNYHATSEHSPRSRRSNSFPTDNEETPRAAPRYGPSNLRNVQGAPNFSSPFTAPTLLARKNSVADTKKSKFREEFSPSPPRKKITPSESIVKFLNIKRLSGRSHSEASLTSEAPIQSGDAVYDSLDIPSNRERRQSESMVSLQTEQKALGKSQGAGHVWDQALKAHQEEKACLFLPKNRDLAVHASPFRERSGSFMTRHSAEDGSASATPNLSEVQNAAGSLFAPSCSPRLIPKTYVPEEPSRPRLVSRRSAMVNADAGTPDRDISVLFDKQGDSPDIVGAWGSYPSHTRNERTNSAGKPDRVESRDFALEAAIKFAFAQDIDEEMIDPTDRIPSMPLLPGEERRKKKVGSGRMTKSNSMNFGKKFLKNYSNIFKSSSLEFRKHGRNHRSSIATGGVLEFPELELLPEVGKRRSSVHGPREYTISTHQIGDGPSSNKMQTYDSMATLRPRRNSSAPNLNDITYDGTNDNRLLKDNARVWSVYYDDCVPSYPRASTEVAPSLEGFGPARFSFESRRPSMRSRTMPARVVRHSRNTSRMSYTSIVSRESAYPNPKYKSDDEEVLEKRSIISVRHSTMDLISKFKEQEIIEHERVLSLTRTGSRYENEILAAL